MKEIITAFDWPLAALIFGIFFLYIFRSQISELILKIRSVSKDGFTVDTELTPQKKIDETGDILKHIEVEKTIMLEEVEDAIFADLKSRDLDYRSDTTKVLVRNLAITQLSLNHEQTYNTIFGSQIHLLKKLNEVSGIGLPEDFLQGFFNNLKEKHEEEFENWELTTYINFLLISGLITFENNQWHITNKGQDFLIWLARNGKNEIKPY